MYFNKKTLIILIALSFLYGCEQHPPSVNNNCNSPMIPIGDICCIDKNNNEICDNAEKNEEQKTTTIIENTKNKDAPKNFKLGVIIEEIKWLEYNVTYLNYTIYNYNGLITLTFKTKNGTVLTANAGLLAENVLFDEFRIWDNTTNTYKANLDYPLVYLHYYGSECDEVYCGEEGYVVKAFEIYTNPTYYFYCPLKQATCLKLYNRITNNDLYDPNTVKNKQEKLELLRIKYNLTQNSSENLKFSNNR